MEEQLVIPHRLDITRESELIRRFVRVSTDELDNPEEDDDNDHVKGGASQPVDKAQPDEAEKSPPEVAGESQSINVDANVIEKEVKKKGLRRRRRHKHRQEELYTDKDRAAAVNMGSRDIKQSLKIKRKQDRSKALSIPEEAEPGTFLALGNYEMCRGDLNIALDFMNKVPNLIIHCLFCRVVFSNSYIHLESCIQLFVSKLCINHFHIHFEFSPGTNSFLSMFFLNIFPVMLFKNLSFLHHSFRKISSALIFKET